MSPTTELQPVDGLEVYAPYFFSLTKSFMQCPLEIPMLAELNVPYVCFLSFFLSFSFIASGSHPAS